MATIHPHFLDREDELAQIEKYVIQWGSLCILIVEGDGGVGKTRLLEEAYSRRQYYEEILGRPLRTTQVLNMDDINLQVVMNLGRSIAQEIGPAYFRDYLAQSDELTLLEGKGLLTPEAFERHVREGDRLFFEAYNAVATKERVFLIVDTVEAIIPLPVGIYLAKMMAFMQNTFLLLAGRDSRQFRETIEKALETLPAERYCIDDLVLEDFSPQTATDYLDQTPVKQYLDERPFLKENLIFLTKRHPLSLALAVEWLRQDMPLPELVNRPFKELASLSPENRELLQQEFESALVSYVRNLHTDIADSILLMAHFKLRFDAELLSAITDISIEESERRISELTDWFFVKEKPGPMLVLHDEMQALVEKYAWPDVDPFRTRRKQLSEKALRYYQQLLDHTDERSRELEILAEQAEEQGNIPQAAEARREYLEVTRRRWLLVRESLHYTLDTNLTQGYRMFVEQFDGTLEQYKPMLRFGLVQEMAAYESQLRDDLRFEVDVRVARYYLDETEYPQAYDLLIENQGLASQYHDSRQVKFLILLANAAIRLGKLQEGNQHFQKALEICDELDFPERIKWQSRAENGLGWSWRLLGQWEKAIEHWERAFEYSSQVKDYETMSQILNNWAYVYHLKGDEERALTLCLQGIEAAKSTSQKGASHSTLGEIYLALNRYEEAFMHYNIALSIFEGIRDEEWIALLYHEISRAKRHQAFAQSDDSRKSEMLQEALKHAQTSLELCERYSLQQHAPAIYYGMGAILLDLERLEEAEIYLEKSLRLNRERQEHFGLIVDLSALAEIAYRNSDYGKVESIAKRAQSLVGDRAEYPVFYGRLLRTLAQVQLDQGQYDVALGTYVEALSEILRHGGYGKYGMGNEVTHLRQQILRLPKDRGLSWADQFIQQWQSDKSRHAPEIIAAVRLAEAEIRGGNEFANNPHE